MILIYFDIFLANGHEQLTPAGPVSIHKSKRHFGSVNQNEKRKKKKKSLESGSNKISIANDMAILSLFYLFFTVGFRRPSPFFFFQQS
jgi:hypothetical protein